MSHCRTHRFRFWWILLLLGVVPAVHAGGEVRLSGWTMGTTWHVHVLPASPQPSVSEMELPARIRRSLSDWNARFSHYDPSAELARVNRLAPQGWRVISRQLLVRIQEAEQLRCDTGGFYDARLGRVLAGLGLGPASPVAGPCELPIPDMALDIRLDPPAIRFSSECVALDFSGWAKGLAVDQLSQQLSDWGWSRHLVEIGGEVRVRGPGPGNGDWHVAVRHPDPERSLPAEILTLRSGSIAVSGTLHQSRPDGQGGILHHLLDPRTGRPVKSRWIGVRVLHPECGVADAWATAFLVGGPEARYPHPPAGAQVRWFGPGEESLERGY